MVYQDNQHSDSVFLSIVVPVYRIDEALLRRCAESLVCDGCEDIEVLLVDDGSPDGCHAICDEYARRFGNVRVFHTENRGVSNARNVGLDHARGDWVTFVDGDDYLLDGFMDLVPGTIADHYDSDVIFFRYQSDYDTSGRVAKTSGTGETLQAPDSFELAQSIVAHTEFLLGYDKILFGAPWGKLIRRSFIEEHSCRFALGVKKSQDRIFMVDLLSFKPKLAVVDVVGNAYVSNLSSVTHRLDPKMGEKLGFTYEVMERTIRERYCGRELAQMLDALVYLRFIFMYNVLDATYLCPFGNDRYRREFREFKEYVSGFDDCVQACDIDRIYGVRNKFLIWCLKRHLYHGAYYLSMLMMDGYLLTRPRT